ncbi:hypothetical protein MSVAZ_1700 [Methanosarcina vacuolata Z-761]|uniref:Uncharacterized protein n=1 Tax=Methanosarcina vacuolata Z-761 TaxID=1434123 RepID=A0A0E3Q5C1_9EURY|nr:hypothetical protein MSVAZ_1700 [Methanosarcina vacuolata Z-761]
MLRSRLFWNLLLDPPLYRPCCLNSDFGRFVNEASRGQAIQVWCLDRVAIAPKLSKACVVQHNEQYI